MKLTNMVRTGALACMLSFGLAAQDTASDKAATQPAQGAAQTNPGYPEQEPNYMAGQTPQTNSTLQRDAQHGQGNVGFDLGWLGLLGLAGLFGLRRNAGALGKTEGHDLREHSPHMSRG
jgi:MYXO-CTERM domain-containing protein